MRKKWWIIVLFLVVFGIVVLNIQRKPKIVSCVTTLNNVYLSVVMCGLSFEDKEKTAEKIVEICKKNEFEEIKLLTDSNTERMYYYITVYKSTFHADRGETWMLIQYDKFENMIKVL